MTDNLTSNLVPTLRDWQTTGLTGCALAGAAADEIDRLTRHNAELVKALEEARDLIRECEPGYIPGCGEYKKLRTKMDEFLARSAVKGART